MIYKLASKDGDGLIEVRQGRGLGVHITPLEGPIQFKHCVAAHRLFYEKKKEIKCEDWSISEHDLQSKP